MAVRLFNALKLETQSLRSTIQEAIISLAAAYKVCYFKVMSTINLLIFRFDLLASKAYAMLSFSVLYSFGN